MQDKLKTARKVQAFLIAFGLIMIGASVFIDVSDYHVTLPFLPHWVSRYVTFLLVGLGIGSIVGSLAKPKAKKAVEEN